MGLHYDDENFARGFFFFLYLFYSQVLVEFMNHIAYCCSLQLALRKQSFSYIFMKIYCSRETTWKSPECWATAHTRGHRFINPY